MSHRDGGLYQRSGLGCGGFLDPWKLEAPQFPFSRLRFGFGGRGCVCVAHICLWRWGWCVPKVLGRFKGYEPFCVPVVLCDSSSKANSESDRAIARSTASHQGPPWGRVGFHLRVRWFPSQEVTGSRFVPRPESLLRLVELRIPETCPLCVCELAHSRCIDSKPSTTHPQFVHNVILNLCSMIRPPSSARADTSARGHGGGPGRAGHTERTQALRA